MPNPWVVIVDPAEDPIVIDDKVRASAPNPKVPGSNEIGPELVMLPPLIASNAGTPAPGCGPGGVVIVTGPVTVIAVPSATTPWAAAGCAAMVANSGTIRAAQTAEAGRQFAPTLDSTTSCPRHLPMARPRRLAGDARSATAALAGLSYTPCGSPRRCQGTDTSILKTCCAIATTTGCNPTTGSKMSRRVLRRRGHRALMNC